jgi:hypothetical protein
MNRKPHHHRHKPPHHHRHPHSGEMFEADPGRTSEAPLQSADESRSPLANATRRPHVTNNYITNQAGKPDGTGVQGAIARILEAVNALSLASERELALGASLARLIEQGRVRGLGKVCQITQNEVNHYMHVDNEPRSGRSTYWG